MLETIIATTTGESFTFTNALIVIFTSILLGIITSCVYMYTNCKKGYNQGFLTTLVMLPVIISIIILLVGNNVARAFSLATLLPTKSIIIDIITGSITKVVENPGLYPFFLLVCICTKLMISPNKIDAKITINAFWRVNDSPVVVAIIVSSIFLNSFLYYLSHEHLLLVR